MAVVIGVVSISIYFFSALHPLILLCTMVNKGDEKTSELLQAHSNVYSTHFGFVNSMSLLSAAQLGIPDIIRQNGGCISLSELTEAIKAPPSKAFAVARLMRLLVHNGIFGAKRDGCGRGGEMVYTLTPSSRLLSKEHDMSMSPFVLMQGEPLLMCPQRFFPEWLRLEGSTPFEMAHGFSIYEGQRPEFSHEFNEAMASDSRLFMGAFVQQCRGLLDGVGSLVDVGGGTGISAKMLADAFPELKLTVLDLPHVISDSPKFDRIDFVAGDMFESIPPADAVLFKWIFNCCTDEECVKILQNCKKAIPGKEEGGRVIIIDMVLDATHNDDKFTQTQLLVDVVEMLYFKGGERQVHEWQKIFNDAGFSNFEINAAMGVRSVIVVYP